MLLSNRRQLAGWEQNILRTPALDKPYDELLHLSYKSYNSPLNTQANRGDTVEIYEIDL